MTLDRRMADEGRLRVKAEKLARSRGVDPEADPRQVGRLYTTHGQGCSCYMCGNPRKHFNEKTIAERKSDLDKFDE
jgi:hypothetical protein